MFGAGFVGVWVTPPSPPPCRSTTAIGGLPTADGTLASASPGQRCNRVIAESSSRSTLRVDFSLGFAVARGAATYRGALLLIRWRPTRGSGRVMFCVSGMSSLLYARLSSLFRFHLWSWPRCLVFVCVGGHLINEVCTSPFPLMNMQVTTIKKKKKHIPSDDFFTFFFLFFALMIYWFIHFFSIDLLH